MFSFTSYKFSPLSLNPVFWVEADNYPGGGGELVNTILDQSTFGNNATQTTSSLRPIFQRNVFNGHSAFVFDASDDAMTTSLSLTGGWAMFVVEWVTSNGGTRRTISSGSNNGLISLGRNDGAAAFLNNIQVGTSFITAGKIGVGCLKTGPTNAEYWLNGVNRTNNTSPNANFGTVNFGAVGFFSEIAATSVLEIVIFNRFISDQERAIMNAHLIGRYGAVEGAL